jgi:hypothetical protein
MNERAFLTGKELAARWRLNNQTLANWRHAQKGPPYIRVGSRVLYPIEGIHAYEKISLAWIGDPEPESTNHDTI